MKKVTPFEAQLMSGALQGKGIFAPNDGINQSKYGFIGKHGRRFLTTKELAAELGVSVRQLERLRKEKSGPPWFRLGKKHIFYLKVKLDEWVEQQLFTLTNNADASTPDAIPHD